MSKNYIYLQYNTYFGDYNINYIIKTIYMDNRRISNKFYKIENISQDLQIKFIFMINNFSNLKIIT